ncbi:MAG TPA: hypothetical protein VKM00_08930 [Luteimonas sp.]|nr:hypothetical protein [Luteimonas sp.]
MKKIFPVVWLGVLAVVVAALVATMVSKKEPLVHVMPFLIMPLIMMAVGIILFRTLLWDLADEVSDGGDYLLVRRRGIEDRVALSDIMNVGMSWSTRPPRLSLRLRKPGKFGDKIVFIPTSFFSLNPFARNPVEEDLIRRVDAARQK